MKCGVSGMFFGIKSGCLNDIFEGEVSTLKVENLGLIYGQHKCLSLIYDDKILSCAIDDDRCLLILIGLAFIIILENKRRVSY